MAVTAKLASNFPLNLGGGDSAAEGPMDLLSDTIMHQLHTSTHTPSQTADTVLLDLDNECSNGAGYTTGGATIGTKTYTTASLVTTFDAADSVWTGLTKTHRYAWLIDITPTSPSDPLIGYIDTGGDQTNTGTDLTYQWNASGIFTLTVA